MSLPPLNLLIPHVHTFKDHVSEYPLHITSTTPAAVLAHCLLHHVVHKPPDEFHLDGLQQEQQMRLLHSVLINCVSDSRDGFIESLTDTASAYAAWFRSNVTSRGKFLYAASMIDVIHVGTLHELRALLYLLLTNRSSPKSKGVVEGDERKQVGGTVLDVPDSQESTTSDGGGGVQKARIPPILAISGMDVLHREAGEFSAQGVSRTLASALDAAGDTYRLVIHDTVEIDSEMELLNESSQLPPHLDGTTTTLRKVYRRFVANDWDVSNDGVAAGRWRSLDDGGGYGVVWNLDEEGQCIESSISRL